VSLVARLAAAAALAVAMGAVGYAIQGAGAGADGSAIGPGAATVAIDIDHSRFSLAHLDVRQGTQVRFVVRNDDPIGHELVVGGPEVHARHANGTELRHPPVPGEVSVAGGDVGLTTYSFDDLGVIEFVCHLPGHEAYGMRGEIRVVPWP
jgi:uncharacterized cupredoxin-like copper-binding protein